LEGVCTTKSEQKKGKDCPVVQHIKREKSCQKHLREGEVKRDRPPPDSEVGKVHIVPGEEGETAGRKSLIPEGRGLIGGGGIGKAYAGDVPLHLLTSKEERRVIRRE